MTTRDVLERFERDLPDLLTELGAPRIPDYTEDLFARTVATRQRPRWTFPERWFLMGVLARRTWYLPTLSLRPVVIAVLLIIALIAAMLLGGTRPRLPPPFGVAANGAIVNSVDGDIYIRDSLTAEPRLLVGGPTNDFAAGFIRNGTKVIFLRLVQERSGGRPELVVPTIVGLDGSDLRMLTAGLEAPDWFDPAPDDATFVVQATENHVPSLFIMDVSGAAPLRKLDVDMPAFTPNFRGPDGRDIVFRGWEMSGGLLKSGIFAVHPDGTGLRPLTRIDGEPSDDYLYPQVSPDGRWVVYSRRTTDDLWRLHLLDIDTGAEHEFMFGPREGHSGFATFSPDGRLLLFHAIELDSSEVQVMVAPVAGDGPALPVGPARRVINDDATLSQSFSPDGRTIIVNHGRSKESRIVDTATGGNGTVIPWGLGDLGGWQRLAP